MKNITEYKPFNGFYDLRDYNLPKKVFLKLWEVQEYLNYVNERKAYFRKMDPITWSKVQELSANYQQCLFSYSVQQQI